MKFFCDCKNKDEAKKVFRKLALLFHPDKGGTVELMIELKKQFDGFENSSYSTYESFTNTTQRVVNIPFDHPIHTRIAQLESKINELKKESFWTSTKLMEVSAERDKNAKHVELLKKENIEISQRLMEVGLENNKNIETIKTLREKPKKNWWKSLKELFNAKQS